MANQAIVPGSSSTSGRALFRKFSTSLSFPGLASNFAMRASFTFATKHFLSFSCNIRRFVLDAGTSGLDSLAAESMHCAAWSIISGLLHPSIVFEHQFVNVAPHPVFARFEGANNGVLRSVKM